MEIKNSSFHDIYRELQALAEFLKANYEYYHYLSEIDEAKKNGNNTILNKYNNAAHKSHTKFVQFWWFLDVDIQMAANGSALSDKIMQTVPCNHPKPFLKIAKGLKHIGRRAYIYSYGSIGRKFHKYHNIDKKHLPDNYPLLIKPWPTKWFTNFNNEQQYKQEKQHHAISSISGHPLATLTQNTTHTSSMKSSLTADANNSYKHKKDIVNLTKICRSLRHLSKQESSAINYLTKNRNYYSHLASYAMNTSNEKYFAKASSAISSANSNKVFIKQSVNSMLKASLSASESYSSIYSVQVAEVSKACNITSQAVINAHLASLSASAIHSASLANRENDLSAINSLKSANRNLKYQPKSYDNKNR